jgi:hypothetical protein
MDITTVILGTLGIASLVGLAWMGGYEIGQAHAADAKRTARPTVTKLIKQLNDTGTKRRARK